MSIRSPPFYPKRAKSTTIAVIVATEFDPDSNLISAAASYDGYLG